MLLGVLINGGVKTLRPLAVWKLYAHSYASSGSGRDMYAILEWCRLAAADQNGGLHGGGIAHRISALERRRPSHASPMRTYISDKVQRNVMGHSTYFSIC